MRRLRVRISVVLLAGAALCAALGFGLLHDSATAPGSATTVQIVEVRPGSSLRSVFAQLQRQGLLEHPRRFEVYLRLLHEPTRSDGLPSIRRGRYRFEPGQTPLQVFQALVEGRVLLDQITLVEGWTFRQWRALLRSHPEVRQTLAEADDATVMNALDRAGQHPEGRFAPDTYRFTSGTTDREILLQALALQDQRLAAAWADRLPDLPIRSPAEALVLASVVEKETGAAAERPQIAGVFVNRLRLGMRLQSDPTVIYGLGSAYDGDLRKADLRRDTPYNSYTRAGLPPTPIAMPGADALRAAVRPAQTDATYFVALGDGSGRHAFSASLDEHNAAVRRYLRRSGARP
jgi:UPF0755 protein